MRCIERVMEDYQRDIIPIYDICGIELRKTKLSENNAMRVSMTRKSGSSRIDQLFIATDDSNNYIDMAFEFYVELKRFVFYESHMAYKTMEINMSNPNGNVIIKYKD